LGKMEPWPAGPGGTVSDSSDSVRAEQELLRLAVDHPGPERAADALRPGHDAKVGRELRERVGRSSREMRAILFRYRIPLRPC